MRFFPFTLALISVLLLTGCLVAKGEETEETALEETVREGFGPIDIPSPEFFWLIQPWKEGKLATIDGWGRFAEISFIGANKLQVKPFSDFPHNKLDRKLITWPEAGLIASTSGKMHHLEAVDDKKTKSHIPLLSWVYGEMEPVLLNPQEGLVGYSYSSRWDDMDTDASLFVYNYKEDRMAFESHEEDFSILLVFAMNEKYQLSYQGSLDGQHVTYKRVFYNWRTSEILENDLTKKITDSGVDLIIDPLRNIHTIKRYLFGYSRTIEKRVFVTWDESYSDIKITPLDYLLPEGKGVGDFILSADGSWGTTFVSGYRGLYNEMLYKRAFFHLDERYPNGISIPVITEDYEEYQWDYSAFVEHPVHGLCFAQEWHKKEGEKDRLYLRLCKMDEVLEEINRQMRE